MATDDPQPRPPEPSPLPPLRHTRSISDVVAASQHALMLAEIPALKEELEAEDQALTINGAATENVGTSPAGPPTTPIRHIEPIRLPADDAAAREKLDPRAKSSVPASPADSVPSGASTTQSLPLVAAKRWVLVRGTL